MPFELWIHCRHVRLAGWECAARYSLTARRVEQCDFRRNPAADHHSVAVDVEPALGEKAHRHGVKTVLGGEETVRFPNDPNGNDVFDVRSAVGDTIVNAKIGYRIGVGRNSQIYAGYGRALAGDTWYDNIWRLEFRLFF